MNKIYLSLLFLVGVINFLPIVGILSLDKINQAYGLSVDDNSLAILLRHRALLFGLIGGFVIYSVFKPQYQIASIVLAAISMLGYLYFFWFIGDSNPVLLKIAQADIVGIVLLIVALLIKCFLNDS